MVKIVIPFHEIIIQIGNKDDMGAKTEDGQLVAKILDEYMQDFQRRNSTLRVFSAYLDIDETTISYLIRPKAREGLKQECR